MKLASKLVVAAALIATGIGGVAAVKIYIPDTFGNKILPFVKKDSANVLAMVNGHPIYDADLASLLQDGAGRTVALDRRITQLVLAQAAEKTFASEAAIELEIIRYNILSNIYTAKRTDAIRKGISDKDIEVFYEKNITDKQSRLIKLKAYVTADAKDAQLLYEQVSGSRETAETKAAIAKMQYLNKEGEHFITLQDIPYNLGAVLKNMNTGDVLAPVVIREGVLVVMLEETKDQPKPTLEKAKEEILEFLVAEEISKEIKSLRRLAKIELKS